MQDAETILELSTIKETLASFCYTPLGKAHATNASFLSKQALKDTLTLLEDAYSSFISHGEIAYKGGVELEKRLSLLDKGLLLSLEDIISIYKALFCQQEMLRYSKKLDDGSLLKKKLTSIESLEGLLEFMSSILDEGGYIKEDASPTLISLAKEKEKALKEESRLQSTLVEKYAPYLNESNFTLREGRYVLPVSITYKNKVKGVLLDISNTGETFFIEPLELNEVAMRLVMIEKQKEAEIARLIALLSEKIAFYRNPIRGLLALIGECDFLQGKIKYGYVNDCHIASISNDESLFLPNARHPLIEKDKVIPNTFALQQNQKILVISGPNAGGKTVALKTVGINLSLFMMGMMVFASSGPILPYLKHIYVDIGDEQSIENNLSTFSGHMANLSSFLGGIGGNDLLLLDEIGTGTSPREGEALAIAILEYLLKKHCYALVSSHFDGVKLFSLSHKGVGNASMLYDEVAFAPTYHLALGLPGDSFGISIASRFGISEEIIKRSNEILSSNGEYSLSSAIHRLNTLSKEHERLKEKIESKERALTKKERALTSSSEALEKKKQSFREDMEEERKQYIEKTIAEVQEIMAAMRENGEDYQKIAKIKHKLEALIPEKAEITYDEAINVDDYVSVPSLELEGKVISIKGKKARLLTPEGLSIEIDVARLSKIEAPIRKEKRSDGAKLDSIASRGNVSLELNLLGMRVDEARNALEKYLDECRRVGFKRVKIIHGYGTLALRNLVHDYLNKRSDFIERFERGGEHEGGGGATIAYLK